MASELKPISKINAESIRETEEGAVEDINENESVLEKPGEGAERFNNRLKLSMEGHKERILRMEDIQRKIVDLFDKMEERGLDKYPKSVVNILTYLNKIKGFKADSVKQVKKLEYLINTYEENQKNKQL